MFSLCIHEGKWAIYTYIYIHTLHASENLTKQNNIFWSFRFQSYNSTVVLLSHSPRYHMLNNASSIHTIYICTIRGGLLFFGMLHVHSAIIIGREKRTCIADICLSLLHTCRLPDLSALSVFNRCSRFIRRRNLVEIMRICINNYAYIGAGVDSL